MSIEITEDQIAGFRPEAQVIIRALMAQNAELKERVDELEAKIQELEAKLNKNSKNSSKPPSATHPHAKPESPKKKKSRRKRGGQPGHDKFQRELIPTAECTEMITRKPTSCRCCGETLKGSDNSPLRKQVHDVVITPVVTEYQLHRLTCECGVSTCGEMPEDVIGETGPMLATVLVLLTSWFRVSRRKAALFSREICNVPCSPGHVSQLEARATAALQENYEELATALPDQSNLAIDEAPFKRGRVKTWLWTFVAASFTVFVVRPTRKAIVLCEAIGEDFSGSINCDRAKMYFQYDSLQWCWAHIKRDFQKLIDSNDNQLKRLGHDLMRETKNLFAEYAKCRDGTIQHATMKKNLQPVRKKVEEYLLRGIGTAAGGMCNELFDHKDNLWTFLDDPNVEPTNNAAERRLRHGVIWRKLSFGTQSERGDRYVEAMLTIIETCRHQNRSIVEFVKHAIQNQTQPNFVSLLKSGM